MIQNLFRGNHRFYLEKSPKILMAVKFYDSAKIVDLCDKQVYPEGVGIHFEKTINFEIYKPHKDNVYNPNTYSWELMTNIMQQ